MVPLPQPVPELRHGERRDDEHDDQRGEHNGEGLIALPQHCKHPHRLAPPPGGGAPYDPAPCPGHAETPPARRGSPISIHLETGPGRPWWWPSVSSMRKKSSRCYSSWPPWTEGSTRNPYLQYRTNRNGKLGNNTIKH